jgi:D-glycero-alpha-D-manno-heptose-7-phosphate kinase
MIIRSKAPFRLGLAGGGTDVSPYTERFGGAVLNATINKYAHVTIIPREDDTIIFRSVDRNQRIILKSTTELELTGELDLQKGVYNRIVREFTHTPLSFELITSMDVPSGSGLGTSSTLVVAMIAAFAEWFQLPLGEYDIAQLAYSIEREDLKMEGGRQDQYAAAFGGFNFMEFTTQGNTIVNPLNLRTKFRNELAFSLILYYTETSRESAHIIKRQQENIEKNEASSLDATHHLKEKAFEMKEVLLKGDFHTFGKLLHESWLHKKQMAQGISNAQIDHIYQTAMDAGALGGKISGAGGGGFMTFYAESSQRYDVIEALEKLGGTVIPYQFTQTGVEQWKTI